MSGSCFFNDNLRFLCSECTSRQWRLLNFKDVCIKKSWGSHSSTVWEKERQQRAHTVTPRTFSYLQLHLSSRALEKSMTFLDLELRPWLAKRGRNEEKGSRSNAKSWFSSRLSSVIPSQRQQSNERAHFCSISRDWRKIDAEWRVFAPLPFPKAFLSSSI